MDTKTIDNALGVIEKGLKITEKDVPINIDQHGDENALVTTTDKSGDIESDYEYQRKQFYNLVEKGSTAIDGIL